MHGTLAIWDSQRHGFPVFVMGIVINRLGRVQADDVVARCIELDAR
jgi:hypothetical protein